MFEELSQRFEDAVRGLKGEASISEGNVDSALKDVRRALLDADVSLPVVKSFIAEVREKALGADVVRGVSPDQQFIKLVHEELVEVMGGANEPLAKAEQSPTVVLMAGLQGAGKTTATAKLGLHLKEQGRKALLVAADTYRPAAIDQLQTLGKQIDVEVFSLGADAKPEAIAEAGLAKGREEGFDTVIVDTAGRLQIDTSMMEEMVRIRGAVAPDEVLLQLWLDTKATLLDGTASADQLKELASAELVQFAKAGRALDAASGKRRKVNARVQALELSSDTPERRVAKATIQYEEKVLSDDGELLGQVEPKQIKNTYVYEKKGDSWQLTDFRPSI